MAVPLKAWINLRRPRPADFDLIYRTSGKPQALPWYHAHPPALLKRVVTSRDKPPGRALDIGCGDGMCSVYLAKAGFEVTALDFSGQAIEMAKAAARAAGVTVQAIHTNMLTWVTPERFDLILDSSCLHVRAFSNADRPRYKDRLLSWLADDGDYVLVHFDRTVPFDWRPIGPRRRSRRELRHFFSPELAEQETDFSDRKAPMPLGPVVRERTYWFRRNVS